MLWWCIAPLMVGRALAVLGLPLGGACPGGEKSFENWYDMPCPAVEPALHAQPVILYTAVRFGFPFGLACADGMYSPVGGKAPSVRYPLRCIPVFPMGAPGCCACVVVRCSCSCPLASRLGSVCWVPGSLCSILWRAPRLWWCVCWCLSAVAGTQGGLAWWHAGLLAWRGGSLGPLPSSLLQVFCDPVPW